MALNISIAGFVYDKDSTISNLDIKYIAYFYKNSTASSDSKWNDVRTVENTGYYSINLGDADWLGQEASALNGAKVLIVFWKGTPLGDDRTATCSILDEWGAFELTLDGSTVYIQDAQTKDNIVPDLHWSTDIPGYPYVDTTYTITNNSEDEHSWNFNGIASPGSVVMNHWYQKYGQVINGPNVIDNTDIFWGDGNSSLNIPGASGDSHWWTSAGSYNIDIVIEDGCGATVTGTESFNMYWHEPVPNIVMSPIDPDPNTQVFFEYSGQDVDDRITSIDWAITDSGAYGNTDTITTSERDDTVAHTSGEGTDWYGQGKISGAFTNPDIHNVEITIHWNDGFSDQIINYDKYFTQNFFSGPSISFSQDPSQAIVSSGISFTNTSTDVDRVGLGLPDHEEYEWTWYDTSLEEIETDKPYAYVFNKTPNSAECNVKLCAHWSNGWETEVICLREDVVFETTVTVIPEECYYMLDIVGTSSDGTISAFGWTVFSGISENGPWEQVWESPTDIYQQHKTLCFTSIGWYRINGFVYGSGDTTSDFETLFISEVCSDTATVYNIWNGTGILDIGTDWLRYGVGNELPTAVYRGTNGLDVDVSWHGKFNFYRNNYYDTDINDYDFFTFWINVKRWEYSCDVYIKFYSTGYSNGTDVRLSDYLITSTRDTWKKVLIPLDRFGMPYDSNRFGWPTMVNRIRFHVKDDMHFWLDNVSFTMGALVAVPVNVPDMEIDGVGSRAMRIEDLGSVSMKATHIEAPVMDPRQVP